MPSKIYIIVPVFNRKSFTRTFLECLRNQTFRNFQTIVVDDGSSDGTAELITAQFQEVQLLRGSGNLWWTGAINMGIRHALEQAEKTDAILIINDDLEVDSHYIGNLHSTLQSMPRTLVGSVVVDIKKPQTIHDGGRIVNWWYAKFRILNSKRRLSDFDENHCVDVSLLTGWGTLIPVQVFRTIGLYDDRHFQQCGDTELPVRAQKAGFRLIVSYAAIVKANIDATDSINESNTYSWKDLGKYFCGIKSNFRLKYRFFFAYNTAENPINFLTFLLFDLVRVSCHFLSRVRFYTDKPAV